MSNAPKVLADTASKYASEAIKFDSQGSRGTAIQKYQQAVDTLLRLAKIHPNYALNKIYLKNAKMYQDRITALQNTISTSENIVEPNSLNDNQTESKEWLISYVTDYIENTEDIKRPNVLILAGWFGLTGFLLNKK